MSYENITLEKGMYNVRGGITAALESIDPSENYKGTDLEGLDAFQRQLKRFDIKVAGPCSDTVEKFYSSSSAAALFPEYLCRSVKTGMQEKNLLSKIVAATTHINGMDYRSIVSNPADSALELKEVAEGAAIPETNVSVSSSLVALKKHGRMLTASYEALKFQRLDLFTVTLKQIGAHIAKQQFNDAITALTTGASASDPADKDKFGLPDVMKLWQALLPYELNTLIVSPDNITKMMSNTYFSNSDFGMKIGSPDGFKTGLGFDIIIAKDQQKLAVGFDKNYALEMVVAQDIAVDSDRLIDKQLERTAITTISGFSKIIGDAVKSLNFTVTQNTGA